MFMLMSVDNWPTKTTNNIYPHVRAILVSKDMDRIRLVPRSQQTVWAQRYEDGVRCVWTATGMDLHSDRIMCLSV